MPFEMTEFESHVVSLLVTCGSKTKWEYVASLESPEGPLLEISTMKEPNRSEPGKLVKSAAEDGAKIIIHHNHLTMESLSSGDWRGLIEFPFAETHAHVSDGSRYWGKIIDKAAVQGVLDRWQSLEMNAMNAFHSSAKVRETDMEGACEKFYRKHVIALAMREQQIVDYGFCWGTALFDQTEEVQKDIEHAVRQIVSEI